MSICGFYKNLKRLAFTKETLYFFYDFSTLHQETVQDNSHLGANRNLILSQSNII